MAEVVFRPRCIRGLREALGLTKAEFARKLGVSHQHLSSLESEEANPTARTLCAVMKSFNIEPGYFFERLIPEAQN